MPSRSLRRLTLALAVLAPLATASSLVAVGDALAANRLPTDVVPTFQSIRLRVDADSSSYSGAVHVDLEVRKPVQQVVLHAEGQKLGKIALKQKGKTIAVTPKPGEKGLLTLDCARPLAAGPATLEIEFTHAFNTQAVALYRMVREGSGYTFTQFQAEHARQAFPCWDEPSFKFPYQITLEIPERHEAVSNTPVARETHKSGWKTIEFEKTPPTPSYLLAIATGPLEFTPIPGIRVPARVVTVKGQSALTGAAVETTPPIFTALEEYFGQPYPYAKLDLIAVPEYWAGAMENFGAITYADNILLADPKAASPAHRKNLLRITSHEIAHMWFGDLVTMEWWDDFWLNESFADWLGDKIADQMAPELQHLLAEGQKVQDIMETDARPSTEPIRLRAESGDDAMRAVQIAYNKGKAVLGMFEQWMGSDVFRRGVNEYVRAHAWGNTTAADFWKALGTASGQDVESIMAPFIEQPGLPLVIVKPRNAASFEVSQRRFLNFGVKADPMSWKIPVSIVYSNGQAVRRASFVLGAEPQVVKLEIANPKWAMPNMGARGYYRWSVPQAMLEAIAHDAAEALAPAERIAFVGNLIALLDAGEIHGDLYLKLLAQMANDPEPLVVSSVIAGLEKARLAFVPDDLREPFAGYVRRALAPAVERFGLEKRDDEKPSVSLMRPNLLLWMGREGRDPAALAIAREVAARHLEDPTGVDASIAGVSLQLNALGADRATYEKYRSGFEQARNPSIRQRYLIALGSFEDPALEAEALRYALEGPVRPNEIFFIPRSIAVRSEAAAARVFEFQRENYDKVAAKLPREFRSFLAGAGAGCSAERYAIAKAFYSDPSRAVPGTEAQLVKVGDQVGDCVGLRSREGAAVAAFLRGFLGAN